jgi:hypothetical protein
MNTGRQNRGWAGTLLCFLLSLGALLGAATAHAQERTGTITGQVVDVQGGVLPGATVTATNARNNRVDTTTTDGNGRYQFLLEPGTYKIAFEMSGFARQELPSIEVLLGRTFPVNATMKVGSLTEAVQVTAESTPLIDARSTMIAHNVTAEEFDRLPKSRTFQSIALTAPSVNSGELEGGFQVNGASGAENSYTVDGVVTNGLVNGESRQNTVFEYLQEVQVKTTGIPAEFGGALGGVLSAVTKSGGNRFTGEGHYYYDGSALQSAPVKRLVLDPVGDQTAFYVQDDKQDDHRNEFGGSIGGPIVRDRLFFFGSYSPRMESRTVDYLFDNGADPGQAKRDITRQQGFGKVSYSQGRVNLHGSALWTPAKADGTLLAFDGSAPNAHTTSKDSFAPNLTRGYEANQVNASVVADIMLSNSSFVSARAGMFHDRYSDTGIPLTTSYTYQTPNIGLAGVPENLQGTTGIFNTPRAQITGFDTTKQRFVNLDYNHTFSAGGLHTLKGGFGFRRVQNEIDSFYPGGYVFIFWDREFTFGGVNRGRGTHGYYEVNDRTIGGKVGGDVTSLYVQDQWTVGDRLTLNVGLRTENERIPSFRPEVQKYAIEFGFADKLAPRIGATYDLRGDGRVKLFGSWGRYYDWTKYELPRGSFGAERWCIHYRGLDTLDLANLSLSNMPGPDLWTTPGTCRDRRVPSFQDEIDPDLQPMMQDSFSAGLEHQVGRNGVLTAHYVRNDLRETIEDIGFLTAAGDEGYLISNPGKRQASIQFPSGETPLGQPVPRPKRQYDAFELGYTRRWGNNWFGSANYTLSRLYGNYAGLASSDEYNTPTTGVTSAKAQQQAGTLARPGGNVNRGWDLDELLYDSHGNLDVVGRLGTDRPHVLKLYGAYQFAFGTQVGAFMYTGSGTPISTYVTSTHAADIFVEGRGDMGRTPVLNYTNLLVSHELAMAGTRRVRLELNVLNLFNQKTSRHIFNYLNRGSGTERGSSLIDLAHTDLTQGYDYRALINATTDGASAFEPRYGMDDLFEDGIRGQFMVKFLF